MGNPVSMLLRTAIAGPAGASIEANVGFDRGRDDAPMKPGELTINHTSDGGHVTLEVAGELDLASSPQLGSAVREACERRPATLVVDIRCVSFIDSTGLRALVEAQLVCKECGSGLEVVVGESPSQRRLLEITGLLENLPVRGANERELS